MTGYHINALELIAVRVSLEQKMKKLTAIGARHVHLADSQVAISIAVKGRSSAKKLQGILCRLNSLMLAASCYPYYVYINTADNPADEPSRRHHDEN